MANAWDMTPVDPNAAAVPSGSAWDLTPATVPVAKVAPSAVPNSFLGTKTGRLVYGMADPIQAGAQMLRHAVPDSVGNALDSTDRWLGAHTGGLFKPTDEAVAGNEATYKASNPDQSGVDWMRVAGNVVSPANYGIGKGLGMLGGAVPAASKLPALLRAVGEGGVYGAFTPVTDSSEPFWDQKLEQIGIGGLGGGLVKAGSKLLGRAIAPIRDAGVQKLVDAGVELTPGQMAGGAARRIEDAATSIPFLGDLIKNAQGRSVTSLNKAVANDVLKPLGKSVPDNVPAGRELIDHVYGELKSAYDNVIPNLSGKLDGQFNTDLASLRSMAKGLPPAQQKQFDNIVNAQLSKLNQKGGFTGETFKGIESELGQAARGYGKDPSFDNRNLGAAIEQVQGSLRDMLMRQNPKYADELQKINQGYAGYTKLRAASASQGATNGVFTPAQLQAAVRAGDSSVGKGAFARGEASFQELSDPAKAILPSTVPDSGTPIRSLLGLGGGALLAHGNPVTAGAVVPASIGIGAASLPYTPAGQKLAKLLLTSRPQGAKEFANLVEENANKFGVRGITPLIQALRNQPVSSP